MGPEAAKEEMGLVTLVGMIEDAVFRIENNLEYGATVGSAGPGGIQPSNPRPSSKLVDLRNRLTELNHRLQMMGDRLQIIG